MSIIQQIREKYAAVGIGFIALSLIGFILMDSAKNNGGGGVNPQDAIGVINGTSISYNEFVSKTKGIENMQEMNGRNVDEEMRQQINAEVWRQMVEGTIMTDEYNKVGIQITDKEFNDLLFGDNPPEWLKSQFIDPATGAFDAVAAKQAIAQIKKAPDAANRTQLEEFYFQPLLDQTLREKYNAILTSSAYVPKFLVEKTLADNSSIASFSFVQIPYTTIPDSLAVVTDQMIKDYMNTRKDEFKQDETMRSIAYVSFPLVASSADSTGIYNELLELKPGFEATDDAETYVARNSSSMPFSDSYFSKERMQMQMKDSIVGAGLGNVYGPYLDGNSYVMSRVIGVRNQPDSVKARHILISTFDRNTQQPSIPDSVAKARIDSIFNAVKGGASFASLAETLSEDPGSAVKGGDLGYFSSGMMVKEFNDFCFEKPTGSIDVVKTQFGYHLIQITDQKMFLPAYKIAYLARNIDPSLETVNDAMNASNQFSGNSRTLKAFDDNVAKEGYNKLLAVDIRSNDFNIQGLGVNRAVVRDIFEAKVGSVLDPIEMSGQYVVIAVTGEEESGMVSVAKARPQVENVLRNKVRADKIISKLGAITTLDALAAANNTVVGQADSISFVSPVINGVGFEPKIGGFAFAKVNNNKVSKPIGGNTAVFVIQTKSVGAKSDLGASSEDVKNNLMNQARGTASGGSIFALRERAKIEDKRNKFL